MSNYCYLAAVQTPEKTRVARIDECRGIGAGDLVRLSDHQLASVLSVTHVAIGGDDYNFISNLVTIEEDWIEIYRHAGVREETHEPA